MDRDDFIIRVYCLVCEHYQVIQRTYRLRRGGFAPALSDEEVITIEVCGDYLKCGTDKDIFDYFRAQDPDPHGRRIPQPSARTPTLGPQWPSDGLI
jgi:hypothetical protein